MTNNQPLVSIIMGVYNNENTIDKCVQSIIDQTIHDWEFIICDDCSNDNTTDLLEKWKERDNRIIVIHNRKNLRLAASLNNCLKEAKGDYIARMDADDISLPNRLEKQVSFLDNNPQYDVVGCARFIFDNSGVVGIRKSPEYPDISILLNDTPFAHPTIVARKEVYKKMNGYTVNSNTTRAEDLEFWFRFFHYDFKGYNIQEPLYLYREEKSDYSKRTIKAGFETSKVFFKGYSMNNIAWYKRIWALKPIISSVLPNCFMKWYHNLKDSKNNENKYKKI